MAKKILQIIPANDGWVAVYKNKDNYFEAPVSLWAIVENEKSEQRITGFSGGASMFCAPDDEISNFEGWSYKHRNPPTSGDDQKPILQTRIIAEASEVMTTGDIGKLLGFPVSVHFLKSLELNPVIVSNNGKFSDVFWAKSDIPLIINSIIKHLGSKL